MGSSPLPLLQAPRLRVEYLGEKTFKAGGTHVGPGAVGRARQPLGAGAWFSTGRLQKWRGGDGGGRGAARGGLQAAGPGPQRAATPPCPRQEERLLRASEEELTLPAAVLSGKGRSRGSLCLSFGGFLPWEFQRQLQGAGVASPLRRPGPAGPPRRWEPSWPGVRRRQAGGRPEPGGVQRWGGDRAAGQWTSSVSRQPTGQQWACPRVPRGRALTPGGFTRRMPSLALATLGKAGLPSLGTCVPVWATSRHLLPPPASACLLARSPEVPSDLWRHGQGPPGRAGCC